MPLTLEQFGLDRLSDEERTELAHMLWDSTDAGSESHELTDAQKAELDRRVADCIARPNAGTPWEVVMRRLLAKGRR